MKSAVRTLSVFVAAAVLSLNAGAARAQAGCGLQGTPNTDSLPRFAGTLTTGNLSTGGASNYLYVVTQWGFARASLANPATPGSFSQVIIAEEPGSGNGGLIQLSCDCHQGATAFAAAEAPDGSARMLSDFNASRQAGSVVTPGQAARADGSGGVRFGQQVKVGIGSDGSFPLGGKIGALYVASSGKYFGYMPTEQGVAVIDLTNMNGQTSKSAALTPVSIFNWSPSITPAKVAAFKVTFGGSDLYLLAGAVDQTIRIATINPSSGIPTEAASVASTGYPRSLAVASVNGRLFVFAAEGTEGLRTYEFVPSSFGGTLAPTSTAIAGNFDRVIVRGGQLPAIFAHNNLSSTQSAIEIYDTGWLTQGGSPRRAFSLSQGGSGEPYFDNSYEVVVRTIGGAVTAFVYRLKSPGIPNEEVLVTTHTVDISCISADLSAPPVSSLNMTNLSALQRSGAEASKHYFGDRWRVQDNSSTAAALTHIEWDWNVLSSGTSPTFQPDAALSGPLPNATLTEFDPAYFPCDPSGALAGNPRTGANCHASLGTAPSGSTYRLGVQSRNANGPSTSPFVSSGVTVLGPLADIAGLDRSTSPNPFVLRVLRGGTANAGPSQGNLEDATFFWTFSTPSGPLTGADVTTTSPTVLVPAAATGFRMNVTYRGGYVSPDVAGNISQVDLVPSFTLSPDPVVKNGSLVLTNTMQIAPAATLNSVDWAITSSSATPSAYDGQLPSGFLTAGGTDSGRTAPGTPGTYHLHLRYNYSVSGSAQPPFLLSRAFTVIDQILLSLAASPTTADVGQTITFTATGGLPTSVYGWNFGDTFPPVLAPGGATNTHVYANPATFTPTVCVTNVSPNSCAYTTVTITGSAPPPPPPPSGLSASLSCPSSAGVGASVSCSVSATGGSSYTYGWNWGDNAFAFSPGPATNSHSYSSAGTYIVAVQVTSGSQSTSATATISVGGSGPPANISATLNCPAQGAAGTPISCTTTASGGTTYTYVWNWGDNAFSSSPGPATHSHTYSSAGGYTVTVSVTSGTASTVATANVNIVPGGPPAPSANYTVTGATPNQFNGIWEAESGRTVTFLASEPDAAATFSWEVSNGGPTLTGRNPSHSFSGTGARIVTLTVTGGGTVTSGVTSTQIRFQITAPRFQALMIPGAGHIEPVAPATDGTWATDLSVTNPGTTSMTLTLYFEPFGTTFPADLSQIPLDSRNNVSLDAGQSYSATDVVSRLSPPKTGRGVLLLKFDGGNADPIATATVYYTQQGRSYGSSLPTFRVGPFGTTTLSADVAGEQTLVGLRNDPNYRFNVSLFNASGQAGSFRLTAFGDDGVQVPLLDETGAPTLSREFPIAPFQQALLQAAELGLTDPTKRYVLKASPSSGAGALLAAASALDRRNNDLVQVSDDTPRLTAAADALIEYFIPGVGRIGRDDVVDGPHWKTDLTLYSSSVLPRDLTFEYRFTDRNGAEQRVLAPVTVLSGRSASLDDIVGTILDAYTPLDLKQESTLGLLRISYRAASDSTANPLLIGGRIYDDRGAAGTAGMQLFVYSSGESVAPGSPLVLPGAQQNLRFRTNIGFFSMGDLPTRVRVSGVKQDGSVAGVFEFLLNDASRSGHYVQLPMSAIPGIVGEPMTVKVEVLEGSRVGAYVVTVDQISSDTVFVQGRPTRLAN